MIYCNILYIFVIINCIEWTGIAVAESNHGNEGTQYYFQHWCSQHKLEYLDDRMCKKIFPSTAPADMDRDFSCTNQPITADEAIAQGYAPDAPLSSTTQVDTLTLQKVVDDQLHDSINLCLTMIKRVTSDVNKDEDPQIYNKYLCLGPTSVSQAYETWSSSKIFGMSFAAGKLRQGIIEKEGNMKCEAGLDEYTLGRHGLTALGDLATVIVSYDETMGYTSNSLAAYFNTIAFREREKDLVEYWLGDVSSPLRPVDAQSLGGDYGEKPPSDLHFSYTKQAEQGEKRSLEWCPIIHDNTTQSDPKIPNSISALSHVELLRRLVLHREIQADMRYPGMTWTDVQQILYGHGTDTHGYFDTQAWGGMTADTGIFLQSAVNLSQVDTKYPGQWRVFSKLGAGFSTSREVGEILTNTYACLPSLPLSTDMGALSTATDGVDVSREFVIHIRASERKDVSLLQAQSAIVAAMHDVMNAMQQGLLD